METLLFIGLDLLDYDKYIISELKKTYKVLYVNSISMREREPLKFRYYYSVKHSIKDISRIQSNIIMKDLANVLNGVVVDKVFALLGTFLTVQHVKYIKSMAPNAYYTLYLWDDWVRVRNIDKNELINMFDRVFSFDSVDCIERGFSLRPLFYIEKMNGVDYHQRTIDISFVGTKHSDRFEKLSSMLSFLKNSNMNYDIRLITGILDYIKTTCLSSVENKSILSHHTVSPKEYFSLLRKSKCVLDIQHPSQKGLTIRTIEALAMGCKVITTNEYISKYNDIPSDLYMIWDENLNYNQLFEFVRNRATSSLPESYSLTSFLQEILN